MLGRVVENWGEVDGNLCGGRVLGGIGWELGEKLGGGG